MRHRSIVTYVVIVTLLAALPQVSRELWAIKSAAGQRLRTGIWNTFLDLHARNSAERATRPRPFQLATSAASADAGAAYSLPARQTRRGRGVRDAGWREGSLHSRWTFKGGEEAPALAALATDAGREFVARVLSKDAKKLRLIERLSGADLLDERRLKGLLRRTRLSADEAEGRFDWIVETGGETLGGSKGRFKAPRAKTTEKLVAISTNVKAPCAMNALPVLKLAPLTLPLISLVPDAE